MAATATAIAAGPGPDERALFEETMRSDARTVPLRSPEVPLRYVAPWTRSRAGSPGPTTMASRTRCTLSHRTWLQNACPAAPPSRRSGGMARRWTHVRHGARAEERQAGVVHPQDLQPTVARLTRAGISVWGSRELRVRGRSSGEWRTTPVNLLAVADQRYLVAPRGETQWVRNLRVAGEGELRVGRHTEAFRATELPDDEKVKVLRAYLKRWKMEVGVFFDGVSADASDSEIRRIAPNHPVFRLTS